MSGSGAFAAFRDKSHRLRRQLGAAWRYKTARRAANALLAEWERLRKVERPRSLPYVFVIDPLNTCNLKCPCCPTGRGELPLKPGKMKLEQFQALIDQIAPHALKLMMDNWGEPFLHRDIIGMVAHAHSRRIATAISSNLNILPEGGGAAIVASGLDDLIVSCDGITQETYGRSRVQGRLDKLTLNLKEISAAKRAAGSRTPHIEFQFLVFKHNEHELPEIQRFARDLGADTVRFARPFVNPASGIEPATDPRFASKDYNAEGSALKNDIFERDADQAACVQENPGPIECFWPWRAMTINWNGQVDPCCGKNYLQSFGNALETPVAELWNNETYRYARRWIAGSTNGDEPRAIVCRGCPGYR